MNIKPFLTVGMLACALAVSADGYRDGIEYYKAGQYDNARTLLQRNLNDPATDKALSYYYLGQLDLVEKNVTGAKANFEKGISLNAENPYNYVGLGACDLINGNVKSAEDYFKEAQKLGKKNHEITVDIARAYFNADPVKYDPQITKLLEKAHKDSKHMEPSIYILEGDMQLHNNDIGTAAAKYEQAINYDKNNPEGYVKYANAYMVVNPLFAVQKLEELLNEHPNSALAQRELAEKYYTTNQWTKAAQQYGKYIQNPNHFPEDKSRYSVLLYANSEYQKSLQVADEILKENPKDFQMQRIRMLDLAALEKYADADKAAQSFLALKPTGLAKFTPNDYLTYASVLENLGNDSLAVFQYEAAVAADPTRSDNIKALSAAYYKNKMYQKAAQTYDEYLASLEDPSLNDIYTGTGRWLVAAGNAQEEADRVADADRGLVLINQVIDQVSEVRPDFLIRKARFYLVKNNNNPDEMAADIYKKALELLDSKPENMQTEAGLKNYRECYQMLGIYYQENKMVEDQNAAFKKYDEINEMLQNL